MREFINDWENYTKETRAPEALVIELTNACSWAKCAHCYMSACPLSKGKFLEVKYLSQVIDYLAKQTKKPKQLWVTGGEPTLHKDIIPILKKLKERNFYVILVSIGDMFANNNNQEILGLIDELQVSARGFEKLHDIMMLPYDDPIWDQVDKELDPGSQINKLLSDLADSFVPRRWQRLIKSLENVSKKEITKISLNIDIHAGTDMLSIMEFLKEKGINIYNIELQVMQPAGRAGLYPDTPSNIWRVANTQIVKKYFEDAIQIEKRKLITGRIRMIDTIPAKVQEELNLQESKWSKYYQPCFVPALSYQGQLITDVVRT